MSSILVPNLSGVMAIAVPIYVTVLSSMAVLAWTADLRGQLAAYGAVSYLVSDALIGYNAFVGPVPYETALTWPTYAGAQIVIVLGIIATFSPRAHAATQ